MTPSVDPTNSPAGPSPPALEVRDLRVTYPARRRQPAIKALRGIDLTINAGQTVAMLGPNGSGKSTLMRVICGLLQPASGRADVTVFGRRDPNDIRRHIGVVFQHAALDPQQSIAEALRDQAVLYGLPRETAGRRIESDLDRAGLADRRHQRLSTLSLGLARRVDLVRALLHRPRLLLLDEPTVGLDPTAREGFLRLIESWRAAQGDSESSAVSPAPPTVLLSTHLVDEAERQDRVILLHEGRLVADDAPAALRHRLGVRIATVHDPAWQPPDTEHGQWRLRRGGWSRSLPDEEAEAEALARTFVRAGIPYTIAPPTLADVFEHCTGSRLSPTAQTAAAHEETRP